MSFDFTCPCCEKKIDSVLTEEHKGSLEEITMKCPHCFKVLISCDICHSFFSINIAEDDMVTQLEESLETRFCENCGWLHVINPFSVRKDLNLRPSLHLLPFSLVQYIQRQINQSEYIESKRKRMNDLARLTSQNQNQRNPRTPSRPNNPLSPEQASLINVRRQLDIIEDNYLQRTLQHSYSFTRSFNAFTESHFRMFQSLYQDEKDVVPFTLIRDFLDDKKQLVNLKRKFHLHQLAVSALEEFPENCVRNDHQLKRIFLNQCLTRDEEWRKRSDKYQRLLVQLSTKVLKGIVEEMHQEDEKEEIEDDGEDGEASDEDEFKGDDFFLFGETDNGRVNKKLELVNKYNLIKRLYDSISCLIF